MKNQRGATLIIVFIVLTILVVASLTFMQTSDTANVVANNIAFKETANEITNIGINQAVTELQNRTNFDTDVPGQYYATQQPIDNNGLPTTVNWSQVPVTQSKGFSIQHITERLCTGPLPITTQNAAAQCVISQVQSGGSNKLGAPKYSSLNTFYYRVTIFVTGPKNTQVYVQAILNK